MVNKFSFREDSAKTFMTKLLRSAFLEANKHTYRLLRPLLFTRTGHQAHEDVLRLMKHLDQQATAQKLIEGIHHLAFTPQPVRVGGVLLPHPFILAAGFVKGEGFNNEEAALQAVAEGHNIIPGWRTMPQLVGGVEFGSFTRWPRKGNFGTVIWRDKRTHSTQNRVGLKNPGARAAACFLSKHAAALPPTYGINIAISPGLSDPQQEQAEVIESIEAFIQQNVLPSWFTLNISCPNTEDDPGNHQTEKKTWALCKDIVAHLRQTGIPLWVKISPGLATSQYEILMHVFYEVGVKAVIATNTLAQPAPDATNHLAGVGGGTLHPAAIAAVEALAAADRSVDIIGCGGVQNAPSYHKFAQYGVKAVQYWSAMVFHGPLVAAMILNEIRG